MSTYRLDSIFRPRAVAVVGSQSRPRSVGRAVVENLRDVIAVLELRIGVETEAAALAERLLVLLAEPYQCDNVMLESRTSIGVALAPRDGADPQSLLQCADLALYAAKAAGRNTNRIFDDIPISYCFLSSNQAEL